MKRARRATMVVALIPAFLLVLGLVSLPVTGLAENALPILKLPETGATSEPGPKSGVEKLRILAVNDLHGNLEPLTDGEGRMVGGAAHLAAYLDEYGAANPGGTIRVHAGDMVGASPLISSHFHDEPTIYTMNLMEFDVGTLGNHEFDEGGAEMLRLINGGQRDDGEQFENGENTSAPDFSGADFPYVGANTLYAGSGERVLSPYRIVERNGVRVGFIGVTTRETQQIVMPDAVEPFRFLDISDTVDRYAAELQQRGVETIVVLAHAGGVQLSPEKAAGEILAETIQMSDAVDVVIAGHTHQRLNVRVDGKLIVEAAQYGTAFDVVDLKVDRASGDAKSVSAKIVTTRNDGIEKDPETAALVREYAGRVTSISERVVGEAARDVTRGSTAAGESALGDLVADSQRSFAEADFAFSPSGGLRADIEAGSVTYGDLYDVCPFGHRLVKMELTGEQVRDALERQYREERDRILQISGLRFAQDPSKPEGQRVTKLALPDGTPLDPEATYTVAVGEFLAKGGGGFDVFKEGRNARTVGKDLEALVQHLEDLPQPVIAPDPAKQRRITLEG